MIPTKGFVGAAFLPDENVGSATPTKPPFRPLQERLSALRATFGSEPDMTSLQSMSSVVPIIVEFFNCVCQNENIRYIIFG